MKARNPLEESGQCIKLNWTLMTSLRRCTSLLLLERIVHKEKNNHDIVPPLPLQRWLGNIPLLIRSQLVAAHSLIAHLLSEILLHQARRQSALARERGEGAPEERTLTLPPLSPRKSLDIPCARFKNLNPLKIPRPYRWEFDHGDGVWTENQLPLPLDLPCLPLALRVSRGTLRSSNSRDLSR